MLVDDERRKVVSARGRKIVPLRRNLVALDMAINRDGDLHSVCVAILRDHPHLDRLPLDAPKAVKAIYRKSVRLRHIMSRDGHGPYNDRMRAEYEWRRHNGGSPKPFGFAETYNDGAVFHGGWV